MKSMIAGVLSWFIFLGVSFLGEKYGFGEQGSIFVCLYIGKAISLVLVYIIYYKNIFEDGKMAFKSILTMTVIFFIAMLATWVTVTVFKFDFVITFELVTFILSWLPDYK